MAYRLAAQISRDRRLAEREEAEFIAEAERLRERREREQPRPQEVVIRIDDGSSSRSSRSSFDRPRRAPLDLYHEPSRRRDEQDRYGARLAEPSMRELRLREEEAEYLRQREIAREIVQAREELRAAIAAPPLPQPRRREPRPVVDSLTGDLLYEREEALARRREPLYQHVQNPRIRGLVRRVRRDVEYEDEIYDDGVYEDELRYDDRMEEEQILREADEYARMMAQRREDELWEQARRRL